MIQRYQSYETTLSNLSGITTLLFWEIIIRTTIGNLYQLKDPQLWNSREGLQFLFRTLRLCYKNISLLKWDFILKAAQVFIFLSLFANIRLRHYSRLIIRYFGRIDFDMCEIFRWKYMQTLCWTNIKAANCLDWI